MGSDRVRAALRALLIAVAGALAMLAWTHALYATTIVAALSALWLAALSLVDAPPPPPPLPPPPRIAPGEEDRLRLTAYLDLSPAPLVALVGEDRLRAVNRAARRLLGTADIVADAPAVLLRGLAETAPGVTTTIDLPGAAEVRRFALTTGDLALGDATMRIGALIDIDAELKAAEAVALRELVDVLSHEIVNALTPIASLADTAAAMLQDAAPPLPEIREAVETVARRAAGLHRFGESYRALARLPAPVAGRVCVAQLTGDLARLFTTRWPDIALTIDTARAPTHVTADADQLVAALWVMLQNAAEALCDASAPRVGLALAAQPGAVEITIDDNGPGIAPGDRQAIFRPFFTTKTTGTGVGLALARQILRGHGGELTLASSVPGDTRFAVRLPDPAGRPPPNRG